MGHHGCEPDPAVSNPPVANENEENDSEEKADKKSSRVIQPIAPSGEKVVPLKNITDGEKLVLSNWDGKDVYQGTHRQMTDLVEALNAPMRHMYFQQMQTASKVLGDAHAQAHGQAQDSMNLEQFKTAEAQWQQGRGDPKQIARWRESQEKWEQDQVVINDAVTNILKYGAEFKKSGFRESLRSRLLADMKNEQKKIDSINIPHDVLKSLASRDAKQTSHLDGSHTDTTAHQLFMDNNELQPVMEKIRSGHTSEEADNNRGDSGAQVGAGRDLLRRDDRRAGYYFDNALDVDPKNSNALSGRAQAKYNLGDYPGANQDAKAALDIDPDDKAALAVSKLTDERGAGAMPSVANLGAQDSSALLGGSGGGAGRGIAGGRDAHYADFNRNSARALSLRDYKEASAQASLALNQNPQNAQAYNFRAMANLGLRDYSKALADASAGLRLAPRNIPLLNSKAQAMLRMKDYKGALDAANAALAINSKDSASLSQKAYALGAMGDREAMLAALRQAAAIDPRYNSSLQSALQLPADSDVMFLFPGEEGVAGAGGAGGIFGKGRRFGLLSVAALAGGLLLAFGLMPLVLPSLSKKFQTIASHWGQAAPAVTPASVLDDIPVEGSPLLRGQYRLGEQIGAGGMGVVFAGLDVTLDRRVAIKRLRAEFAADRRERERFIAEAKTVAGLKHPNIVEIYAIVEEDSDVFLIFEHIPGGTLFDRIAKQGPMSISEGLVVLKQISAALEYAHSKGIIHRDLKPSNVMFDSEGQVKVMDFGIARVAKDAMNRFTLTNTVVGTPPYMAPEQEQGVVGRQADVYALAVCYYEMLSGRLPFNGTSAGLLVNKMNMNYKPITAVVEGLPAAYDEVFAGAFVPDPEKRPGSPSQLLAAIESVPVA